MNILVFVKATLSRTAELDPEEIFPGDMDDSSEVQTNPYDKHAIEAALRLVEEKGEGKVTAVCLGSDMADKVVKEAIAMGCTEAIRIENSDAEITNFFSVAKILAAAAMKLEFDLLLFGMQSYDYGTAAVGPMVAEMLQLPSATYCEQVTISDGKAAVRKVIEGGTRDVQVQLPAVLTIASTGDYEEPRYTPVRRIMQASRTKVPVWVIGDLDTGDYKPSVEFDDIEQPPARTDACQVFKDADASDLVNQLLGALKTKGLNLGAYK
ncbi:MAG: electron transfer flavoprotein subunit beta/FixA family protein [Candidatus Heimdallarchaeota archaeon]